MYLLRDIEQLPITDTVQIESMLISGQSETLLEKKTVKTNLKRKSAKAEDSYSSRWEDHFKLKAINKSKTSEGILEAINKPSPPLPQILKCSVYQYHKYFQRDMGFQSRWKGAVATKSGCFRCFTPIFSEKDWLISFPATNAHKILHNHNMYS